MTYKFLTDHPRIKTAKKVAIDSLFTAFSPKPTSHRGAEARILCDQIVKGGFPHVDTCEVLYGEARDNWEQYDLVILDMGMEFRGTALNFIGGVPPSAQARIDQWERMPKYTVIQDFEASTIYRLAAERGLHCDERVLDKSDTFLHIYPFDNLVLGDSHALSVYTPDRSLIRLDGKTLYGALKIGEDDETLIQREVRDYASSLKRHGKPEIIDHLTVYFGNIDVRMHFRREDAHWPPPAALAESLVKNLIKLREDAVIRKATVVGPLPIEDPVRVIPKSGYFKGRPYHGSWAERTDARDLLEAALKKHAEANGFSFWGWPESYENEKGELHVHCMEAPRSVHLAQTSYIYDLTTGEQFVEMDGAFLL